MKTTLDEQTQIKICEEYKNKTLKRLEIIEKYDISEKIFYNILKRHNIKATVKRVDDQKLLEEIKSGNTDISELAKKYGCSQANIFYILKKNNIKLPESIDKLFTEQEQLKLCAEYKSDKRIENIYRDNNITQYMLFKILDKYGIPKDKKLRQCDYSLNEVSKDTIDAVCEDYLKDIPVETITKTHGISRCVFHKIVKSKNVYKTKKQKTVDKQNRIIDLYNEGMSPEKISKILKMGSTFVTGYLRDKNIELRPAESYIRKYTVDQDYFSVIDTPDKAQLLGMLTADGYVPSTNVGLILGLHEDDKGYLEHFKYLVKSDAPIFLSTKEGKRFCKKTNKEYNCSNNYKFAIYNKKIVDDVARHNIIPNKTHCDLGLPQTLPKHLIGAFCAGFLFGDGSVSLYSYQKGKWENTYACIKFLCQPKMGEDIKNALKDQLDIDADMVKPDQEYSNNLHFMMFYDRERIIKLFHWMFKDATFVMKRKYEKYISVLNFYKDKGFDVGDLSKYNPILC